MVFNKFGGLEKKLLWPKILITTICTDIKTGFNLAKALKMNETLGISSRELTDAQVIV